MIDMNSGKFRHYVVVLEKLPTGKKNIIDEDILEFKKIGGFWGEFKNRTGSMLYGRNADTKLAKTTHKLTYRYLNYPQLDTNQVLQIDNFLYDIEYVDDLDNRHEVMEVFLSRRNKKIQVQKGGN